MIQADFLTLIKQEAEALCSLLVEWGSMDDDIRSHELYPRLTQVRERLEKLMKDSCE